MYMHFNNVDILHEKVRTDLLYEFVANDKSW